MKKSILIVLLHCCLTTFGQRGAQVVNIQKDSIGTNYALVVGISKYANIPSLNYAADDADLFADYLINEQICQKKNVIKLIDSSATIGEFYKELKELKNIGTENDRVFIYFAGHGDVENDIETGFLLPYNCEANSYSATAIDISTLEKYINAMVNVKKMKVVLITDACRSGNLAGGLTGSANTMSAITKSFQNIIKILSCQPNQLSLEKKYPGGGHGVFTYHLVEGLSGMADKNGDHQISLRELDLYLDEVSTETNQMQIPKVEGNPQTNIVKFDETQKIALIARKANKIPMVLNEKKGRGPGDSAWAANPYFMNFVKQVRSSHYTSPLNANAYNTIIEAINNKQPTPLVENMKLDLAAVLEDEAQKWINKYLRGELDRKIKRIIGRVLEIKSYMELVEKLIGEKDLRYNEIHVKQLFFSAYYAAYDDKNGKNRMIRTREALDFVKTADKLSPNEAWILHFMAHCYEELNEYDKAVEAFKRAAYLAPSWPNGWSCLGGYYDELKKYKEEELLIRKAIEINPKSAWAWEQLATYYEVNLKKHKEAESLYKKTIQLDSGFSIVWQNLGILYSDNKKYDSAKNTFRKGIEASVMEGDIYDNLSVIWKLLGQIYEKEKNYTEAEMAFTKAVEYDSTNKDALEHLTRVYYYLKRYHGEAEALRELAFIYKNEKNFSEAENLYAQAISIDQTNYIASYQFAGLLSSQNKIQKAIKYLEIAIKNGFWDFNSIENDIDMDNIRKTTGYIELIKKYRSNNILLN